MTLEEKCYFLSLLWRHVEEGEREKGCVRWWITHLHRKRVLKELGWSLRLMSVAAFCFDTFLCFQKQQKTQQRRRLSE
jgi:hypothetical protein